jgi:hypothetical protein
MLRKSAKIIEETSGEAITNESVKKSSKKLNLSKKHFLLAGVIILFLAGVYAAKGWLVAAVVNNQPISRMALDRELEKQGGKQVLENKISEILILNEAKKQKVIINQTEVDARIKQIEDQVTTSGQKLDDLLAQQGQTRAELQKQMKVQMLIEKMLEKDTQVTDKEISDYFTSNSSSYPKGTKLEDKKADIQKLLSQQKLSEKFQPWLDGLHKSAKVMYFVKF